MEFINGCDGLEIIDDYRILTFHTGLWKENTYLVHHLPSADMLVVDPGGKEDQIIQAVEEEGGKLSVILLTHAHHDHVGGVKGICDRFNLPFYLHPADKKLLYRAPLYAMGMEKRTIEAPENYIFLSDKALKWDGGPIQFLHVPGHTQGSVCYYWKRIAFTGDTLLNRRVGRTDLPGADPTLLSGSIAKLLQLLPLDTKMFPGHFQPWLVSEALHWWKTRSQSFPEYR